MSRALELSKNSQYDIEWQGHRVSAHLQKMAEKESCNAAAAPRKYAQKHIDHFRKRSKYARSRLERVGNMEIIGWNCKGT